MKWNVLPVDAPDSTMYGFPLPYSCDAWHTSTARQYFILEVAFDFIFYFSIWAILIVILSKLKLTINSKILSYGLIVLATILLIMSLLSVLLFESTFDLQRDFDFETKSTEIKLLRYSTAHNPG